MSSGGISSSVSRVGRSAGSRSIVVGQGGSEDSHAELSPEATYMTIVDGPLDRFGHVVRICCEFQSHGGTGSGFRV